MTTPLRRLLPCGCRSGVGSTAVVQTMHEDWGVTIADGEARLKGNIVRIGHSVTSFRTTSTGQWTLLAARSMTVARLVVGQRSRRPLVRNRRDIAALAGAGRAARRRARTWWEVRAALRQARRHSSHPAPIRVCWDLDNTLVNSGALLRAGHSLRDAIVRADAVPNMLEFFAAVHSTLPDADHFILTARVRAMRRDTETWLLRHGLAQTDAAAVLRTVRRREEAGLGAART